jgi:ubiquinone/menaquinone biosynthesis C-methylase UbiE
MDRFLGEVVRVLRPGGQFLWVDMRPRGKFDETREQFRAAGLGMLQETEITGNVVHALDLVTDRKREAISKQVPKFLMPYFEDFAGVRGTRVYEALKAGDVQYWRCALQKPG